MKIICKNDELTPCKVKLGKIGKSKNTKKIPIPSTGEPEDIISDVDLLKSKEDVPDYYEICINSESDYPIGGVPMNICSECGREKLRAKLEFSYELKNVERPKYLFFKTTNYVIITDNLKIAIDKHNPSNCKFTEITFKE